MPAPRRVLAHAMAVVATALVAALVAAVPFATPAAAHAVLIGTSPERGQTVTDALAVVTLTFSESVAFPQVQVTGPDGQRVEEGLPVELGESVEQPLAPLTEHGTYQVAFRVTSDDGHPIEGELEFVYAGPMGETADPPDGRGDAVTGEDDGEALADPPGQAGGTGDETGREADTAGRDDAAGAGSGPVLVVALLAVLGFAVAAVLAVRRRGGGDGQPQDPTPSETVV